MRLRIVRTKDSHLRIYTEDGIDLTEKLPITRIEWECNGETGFQGGKLRMELEAWMLDIDILPEDVKLQLAPALERS